MIVGIPKEIKQEESRVSLTPSAVREITLQGHKVLVEQSAGGGSGFPDDLYKEAGAIIQKKAKEVWEGADIIIKVKEPIEQEYGFFRKDLIIFTYLHLAADRLLTEELLSKGVVGIAYETVELEDGSLPLLAPMSEIAGRIAVQEGAGFLARHRGGKGVLMGGIAGTSPARVLILGAGMAGKNAAAASMGLGAEVTVVDIRIDRLRDIQDIYNGRIKTAYAAKDTIKSLLPNIDMVIGCVLVPGGKAPSLINREMLGLMDPGSVLVDVAIDQGGCFETSRPTTHKAPVYVIDGIIHYCVANMPGCMPKTATTALSNVTLPFILTLLDLGLEQAMVTDQGIRRGVNTFGGSLMNKRVAEVIAIP